VTDGQRPPVDGQPMPQVSLSSSSILEQVQCPCGARRSAAECSRSSMVRWSLSVAARQSALPRGGRGVVFQSDLEAEL